MPHLKMSLKIFMLILWIVTSEVISEPYTSKPFETSIRQGVDRIELTKVVDVQRQVANLATTSRRSKLQINPFRAMLAKPRVSPLYLINGTVCRFINFQPVCTTLSTTGLSVGGGTSSGGVSSGGAGGSARPSSGSSGGSGGSGGGGGGSGGSGGSGGTGGGGGSGSSGSGSSGSRPNSSGLLSGGSSVQFASQPARASAIIQDERPEAFVERVEGSINLDQSSSEPQAANKPIGVLVARRPFRLLPFRRPTQYQIMPQRQGELENLSKTSQVN